MERGKEAEEGGEEIKYFMMTCWKKNRWKWGGGVEGLAIEKGNGSRKDGGDTLICPV